MKTIRSLFVLFLACASPSSLRGAAGPTVTPTLYVGLSPHLSATERSSACEGILKLFIATNGWTGRIAIYDAFHTKPVSTLDSSGTARMSGTGKLRFAAKEIAALKELLENSLDAGATRIDIDLAQGGINRLRVADDGAGMSADDLPLALSRHATSKIASLADLERVTSLGFRGEALASLAAVSRLIVTSRQQRAVHASRIEATGGALAPVEPAALEAGTVVTAEDLFFTVMQTTDRNAPVRWPVMRIEAGERVGCVIAGAEATWVVLLRKDGQRSAAEVTVNVPATKGGASRGRVLVTDLAAGSWEARRSGASERVAFDVTAESGAGWFEGGVGEWTLRRVP